MERERVGERLPATDLEPQEADRGPHVPLLLAGELHGITSFENSASTPNSSIACTMQLRFQTSTFASTSLRCAMNVLERTLGPTFA